MSTDAEKRAYQLACDISGEANTLLTEIRDCEWAEAFDRIARIERRTRKLRVIVEGVQT